MTFFRTFAGMIANHTNTPKEYRILALDDHPMVTEGISHLFSDYAVTTVTQSADVLALLNDGQQFHLFIIDLELPDADGFEVLATIRHHCSESAILIYTMHEEPWILARLASIDIQGVVSKAQPVAHLRQAVETIRQGGTAFDEAFMQQLQHLMGRQDKVPYMPGNAFQLSEREQQVLQCMAQGMTTQEIAAKLFLSENTVGTYRHRLMTKFDAHNVAQLIVKARWHLP